ncbi:MAG: hypothetical protein EP305_02025 [Bacteroidetes bacterium]|nr:MAG: hypothetical protein EP305_02025 [Bacteroidota bacterium]
MVRIILFSAAVLFGHYSIGQQEQYIRQGTLKASATIAPSKMLNRDVQNIYIHGFLAYQLEEKLSLRGESFFYIPGAESSSTVNMYSSALNTSFGAFYHETKNNWDSYLGFQPGLSIIQSPLKSGTSFNPTFSMKIGTAYYVWKYFHFFAELTYVNSTIRGFDQGSLRADELIFSAGLGFQINTKKTN